MIRRIEPHASEPTFTGTVVLFDEGGILGSVAGLNIEGANTEAVVSGTFGHVAIKPRTWGGVAVRYNFVTGSSIASGDMNFNSLTGSLVTEIKGAWVDKDGGLTHPRLLDIAGAFGTRIVIWSEHDPSKWWMGSMGPSFSAIPPSFTTLSVEEIHHQGGETPFDQDESVVLSTSYQRNQTGTVVIYDEGDFLANFKEMRFIGSGVEVFNSGSYAAVSIAGGGGDAPVTGSFVVFDEGTIKGSVLGMNVTGDNVEVVVSGSFAHLMVTGSAGGGGGAELTVVTGTFYVEEILYEVELASATGSIVIPGISQDYDHLRLVALIRTDNAANDRSIQVLFNGDTTASNYFWTRHIGSVASHSVGEADERFGLVALAGNAPTDNFSHVKLDILDYAGTSKNKVSTSLSTYREAAGDFRVTQWILDWENTAAINRIDLATPNAELFDTGTIIQLIGIKETVLVTSVEGTTEPSIADLTVTTGTFDVGVVLLDEAIIQAQSSFYASGSFGDYEYIEIHITGRGSDAGLQFARIALNGDTTDANYGRTHHTFDGSTHNTFVGNDRLIARFVGTGGSADAISAFKITIFNPGDATFHKAILSMGMQRHTVGAIENRIFNLEWEDTSAITEISLDLDAGNFIAGSRCKIVGYKASVVVTDVSGGVLVDGVTDFLALDDTPASYSGQSGSYARVNSAEDALEFTSLPDIGARAYNDANISISNATFTALTFNQERWDTDGIHSTSSNTERLTAQKAGKYIITGHIEFAFDGTGTRIIGIRLNGSTYLAQDRNDAISGDQRMSISTIWNFVVGDYVELVVYQTSGGNLNIKTNANMSPEFSMQKMG